jgi:hypothetical protein
MTQGSWVSVSALAVAVLAYYGLIVRKIGEPILRWAAAAVSNRSHLARRYTAAQLDGALRLLIAGSMQAVFTVVALAVTPASVRLFALDSELIWVMLLAVMLAVAEFGLGSQVVFIATRVADALSAPGRQRSIEAWITASRGGWIRYYTRTAESMPRPVVVALTLLYVGGEEVMFRGVVLSLGDGLPVAALIIIATALFVVCQMFYTPNWRTALFPMVGAAVLGATHCLLYVEYPVLAPLVVAHACMFLASVY